MQSPSEKDHLWFVVIHMRNLPQLSETRRVTQKTPLKTTATSPSTTEFVESSHTTDGKARDTYVNNCRFPI